MSYKVTHEQPFCYREDVPCEQVATGNLMILTKVPPDQTLFQPGDPVIILTGNLYCPTKGKYANPVSMTKYRCRELHNGERVVYEGE